MIHQALIFVDGWLSVALEACLLPSIASEITAYTEAAKRPKRIIGSGEHGDLMTTGRALTAKGCVSGPAVRAQAGLFGFRDRKQARGRRSRRLRFYARPLLSPGTASLIHDLIFSLVSL